MKEAHKKIWIRIIAAIIVIAFLATGVGVLGGSIFG